MIGTIAAKELKEIMRDGRIKSSAAIIGVMLLAALATAAQRYLDISVERDSAQAIVTEQWLDQGEKNPHAAAHYGVYAFKPVTPSPFSTQASAVTPGCPFGWRHISKTMQKARRPKMPRPLLGLAS